MSGMRLRIYDTILSRHLSRNRQMAFVTGPRQVGKTTTCRRQGDAYLNMDDMSDRRVVMAGPASLASHLDLARVKKTKPVAILDELHRWKKWQTFLKGFFDKHEDRIRIVVTGSSRLDLYRRGGDSMMGRYFPYRMHPFSVGEIARQSYPAGPINPPSQIPEKEFEALWKHGGYPEPFLKRNLPFTRRWQSLRLRQLLRDDLRDLTSIQELAQVETVSELLGTRSSTRLVYKNIAETVNSSVDTIRRWVSTFVALHHGFLLRPWHRKVSRSLLKEPKWHLRDWSSISDPGARAETFVACHLLKAVEGWTDVGLGEFGLYYLRDKQQREVDFLVVRDATPWFLVEVKKSDEALSPALSYFQRMTGAKHAFQLVIDMPYVDANCFSRKDPAVVPARTLLSQLL